MAYTNQKLMDDFVLEKSMEKIVIETPHQAQESNKYSRYNVFKFDSLTYGLRDSIIIIFDNKKQIVQVCGGKNVSNCIDIPKNLDIIAQENNKWKKNRRWRRDKTIRSYTRVILNNEDYERATLIKN